MDDIRFSKKTDLICLLGMSITLSLTLISSYVTPWPAYKTGYFWAYIILLSRYFLYWTVGGYEETKIFRSLLYIGVVAGFVELLADYWLVHGISAGRLIYMRYDVVLCASPIWMPIAWATTIVEFSYIILRMVDLIRKPWLASILGGLMAGTGIGIYEFFAVKCGWWYYAPAKVMIGNYCALYIPLGEALLFLCFYSVFNSTRSITNAQARIIMAGTSFGLLIFLAYAVAYYLLEVM